MRNSNHSAVPAAWRDGRPLTGGALRTDGHTIWSYSTIIGETDDTGRKVAVTPSRGSVTTSRHFNGVLRVADVRPS
jgi:hypothetical protein